jgi:hypothetical protein
MGERSAAAGAEVTRTEPGDTGAAGDAARPSPLALARVLLPLYALAAVVLTWPLGRHLATRLTTGTEPTDTVPLFNLWTLRWNQQRIGHLWAGYWDAPLFHPTPGTFALSEPQPLTGLAFAPVAWLTGNPVLAMNVVALAILALNGWAAARLARHLGVAPAPAALAGLLAVGLPFVVSQAGVLQLTAVFPLLLVVDALVRWAGGGGRRAAAATGLWLAATFLTCGYYGLFAVLGIGLPALVLVRRDRLSRDGLVEAGCALAGFLPAVPFLVGQEVVTADYARSEETIRQLSAWASDHLLLREGAAGAGVLPWVGGSDAGIALYPGTALLVLAVGGAWVAWSERRVARRVVAFLVAGAVGTRVLSLGLELSVLGVEPYRLVRAVVPGYADLRSPNRAAAVSEVFLVALAAFGLDALWRWRPAVAAGGRRAAAGVGAGALLAGALVAANLAEGAIAPVDTVVVDRSTPDWAAWLEDRPTAEGGDGAGDDREVLAFLPFPPDGSVESYAGTARRMLQVLDAGVTTVNGYSGLWPPSYDRLEAAAREVPNDELDALLREHGVTIVVVEAGPLASRPDVEAWLDERYVEAFRGPDSVAYEVPAGPA